MLWTWGGGSWVWSLPPSAHGVLEACLTLVPVQLFWTLKFQVLEDGLSPPSWLLLGAYRIPHPLRVVAGGRILLPPLFLDLSHSSVVESEA